MFDLGSYLASRRAAIERALAGCLGPADPEDRLLEAMRYSLMAGGKRLRPILCLSAAAAVGGEPGEAMPAACALEMIHTYSLIHDDLPAMDDDALRRGRPTCHVAFDEATAILAGDALLTLAFEVLCAPADAPAERRLEVARILASAAGFHGMVQGQMLDMRSEGKRLSRPELERLHALKTGAMIEASVACGAVAGGGTARALNRLAVYGKALGLAYQVVDDILNVEGDASVMGKAIGTDSIRGKNTYPALLGLEKSKALASGLVEDALHALSGLGDPAEPLRAIARYILDRNR